MKILYLVQTYKGLSQIQRLVKMIRQSDPSGTILISHNQDSFVLDAPAFEGVSDVHIVNVNGGSRLDFSLPASYLAAIEKAYQLEIEFDWVVNMTGQCYPVRPLQDFVQLLSETRADGFIEYRQVFDDQGRGGGIWPYEEAHSRYRYQYHWRFTQNEPASFLRKSLGILRIICHKIQPWIRFDTSYALQIGLRDRSGLFGPDFRLFGGSYYMTLSRRAIDYIRTFTRANAKIKEHFSRMNIPSEVYFHTILLNNPELTISNKHHFCFNVGQAKRGRPFILGMDDLERITISQAFFARKFDPTIDSEVLDVLDQWVFSPSQSSQSMTTSTRSLEFAESRLQ